MKSLAQCVRMWRPLTQEGRIREVLRAITVFQKELQLQLVSFHPPRSAELYSNAFQLNQDSLETVITKASRMDLRCNVCHTAFVCVEKSDKGDCRVRELEKERFRKRTQGCRGWAGGRREEFLRDGKSCCLKLLSAPLADMTLCF